MSQGYQTSFNSYPYDKDTLPVVYGQLCVSFVNKGGLTVIELVILAESFSRVSFWALAIQQKFRFEISEISRAQWNGAFRWHRPDSCHHPFGYCSCKQDTKERYWGQKFCQIKQDISVRPTEITVQVKVDHLQGWSRIFRSDQTEMVRCI